MIIGLCGRAGCGKSTVAEIIESLGDFAVIGFADPLYEMLSCVTGITQCELRDRGTKERVIPWVGKSPRQMLQTLGTEWGRQSVSETLWVDILLRKAAIAAEEGLNVVVDDVRFDNEAEAIVRHGGVVWRVERPAGLVYYAVSAHASEAGVSGGLVSSRLINDGDMASLRRAVFEALDGCMAGSGGR